jgi:hypothetical protein
LYKAEGVIAKVILQYGSVCHLSVIVQIPSCTGFPL